MSIDNTQNKMEVSNREWLDRAFETFILAMAANPEVQKQAQKEIDEVFGQDEMPHTADGKKMPFIKACFLEVIISPQLWLRSVLR